MPGCWGNVRGAGGMLECWWNAEVLVECQGANGMLGVLVECQGAGGMPEVLVECQGAGGKLGVPVEC